MPNRPLYKKVKEQLTASLLQREWPPGAMLPSEPQLAQRYHVGISTVRAAIKELTGANVLVRTQGKGTFVSRFENRPGIHRFFNLVRHSGSEEPTTRKLLSCERIKAPDDIAEALRLPRTHEGQIVFCLTTLLSLAQTPKYYSRIFLPATVFAGLKRSMVPDGGKSLYSIYQERFNVNVIKVVDRLRAVAASAAVAKACHIKRGSPVLEVLRIAYSYNDVPVEVRERWISTTEHWYRIEQGYAG